MMTIATLGSGRTTASHASHCWGFYMLCRDVKLRAITPGLVAKVIGVNEIPQKEAYTRRGSLFMRKIERDVPEGQDEDNMARRMCIARSLCSFSSSYKGNRTKILLLICEGKSMSDNRLAKEILSSIVKS